MSEQAVERLEHTRAVNSVTQLIAGIDGIVLERKLAPGQVVQPADTAFVLADLTNLWLIADVPGGERRPHRAGQGVRSRSRRLSGQYDSRCDLLRERHGQPGCAHSAGARGSVQQAGPLQARHARHHGLARPSAETTGDSLGRGGARGQPGTRLHPRPVPRSSFCARSLSVTNSAAGACWKAASKPARRSCSMALSI